MDTKDLLSKTRIEKIENIPFPSEIYFNPELNCTEKMLLCEIINIYKQHGICYANNEHFANFLGFKISRVQQLIRKLEENGYIERRIEYKENSKEIKSRYIIPTDKCGKITILHEKIELPPCKILHDPHVRNCVDKNTFEEDINVVNIVSQKFCDKENYLLDKFNDLSFYEKYLEVERWSNEVMPKVIDKILNDNNISISNRHYTIMCNIISKYVERRNNINKHPHIVSNKELTKVVLAIMKFCNYKDFNFNDMLDEDVFEDMMNYFFSVNKQIKGRNNVYAATMFFNFNMMIGCYAMNENDTTLFNDIGIGVSVFRKRKIKC